MLATMCNKAKNPHRHDFCVAVDRKEVQYDSAGGLSAVQCKFNLSVSCKKLIDEFTTRSGLPAIYSTAMLCESQNMLLLYFAHLKSLVE